MVAEPKFEMIRLNLKSCTIKKYVSITKMFLKVQKVLSLGWNVTLAISFFHNSTIE
jgi:hypothetical protein